MVSNKQKFFALLDLLLATSIWGFGFIATKWVLAEFSTSMLTFLRFFTAFVVGLVVCRILLRKLPRGLSANSIGHRHTFVAGILLGLTLLLQTAGLLFTTATKSAFITTLYAVFVPLLEAILMGKTLHQLHWLGVILALAGMYLMGGGHLEGLNLGDFLTLLAAIVAALHIVWLGFIRSKIGHTFLFNTWQSFWCSMTAVLVMPFMWGERDSHYLSLESWRLPSLIWIGLAILSLGSTLVAFGLQIRAQKVLSPSLASLLFILEAPFAMFFAMALLDEHLLIEQIYGASLILFAAALASWVEFRLPPKTHVR